MSCINHDDDDRSLQQQPFLKAQDLWTQQHTTLLGASLCSSPLQHTLACACKIVHEVLLVQDTKGRPSSSGWHVRGMDDALFLQPSPRAAAQHRPATK